MGAEFGGEIPVPRVASLRAGVEGVLPAARLGVRAMGHGVAVANGLAPRPAIKQIDRLLSTPKLLREAVARGWVHCAVAERKARCVNFDGTALEDAEHPRLGRGPQTEHGRSPPLVWTTVPPSEIKDSRQAQEDELRGRLAEVLPQGVRVTVVADRGVSDSQRSQFLQELGFEDIMRVRGVVSGASADGKRRQAKDWLGAVGQMRGRRGARGTDAGPPVPIVVCVQQKRMQEPWRLASRRSDRTGPPSKHRDSTRFTVEATCRDVQNPRLGLGLMPTVRARHDRRAALFLLAVRALTRLTRLGNAGEERGMDRGLGATRPRPSSRFRHGQRR